MYERPASAYSTGLAQLLMKAREEVAARQELEILFNLCKDNQSRDYSLRCDFMLAMVMC